MPDINVSFGANTAGVQQALALVKQAVNKTSAEMRQTFNNVNNSVVTVNSSVKAVNGTLNETNNKFVTINNTVEASKRRFTDLAEGTAALRNSFRIATATVSTLTSAASEPLKQFARYEDAATRLAPLVGSFEEAEALARDLRDAAANGTMDFERLTSVAGRLASVFKDRSDILKWTEAFHNLSAGTGLDMNELIGNFTKAKASGRFEAGFLDMFAQKGVNIYDPLAKELKLSEAALREMAKKGELEFSRVERAILSVSTGAGKFAGQASKMSNTFSGSVATMRANWDILLAELGKPVAEALTPLMQSLGKFIRANAEEAQSLGRVIVALGKVTAPVFMLALTAKSVLALRSAFTGTIASLNGMFAASSAGFAKMSADARRAGAQVASVGAAAKGAKPHVSALGLGLAGVLASAVQIGASLYVAHKDEQASAAEKLTRLTDDLAAALRRLDAAADPEQLQSAYNTAQRLADAYEANAARLKKAAGMNPNAGLNIETTREVIAEISRRKEEEFQLAEAIRRRADADARASEAAAAVAEATRKARERLAALDEARSARAAEEEVALAPVWAKEDVFAKTQGFAGGARELAALTAQAREAVELSRDAGTLTSAQVAEWEKLVALSDKANALARAARADESAARAAYAASTEEYEAKVARLEAELSGNTRLVDQLDEQARLRQLTAQYERDGVEAAEARARAERIVALEREKALRDAEKLARAERFSVITARGIEERASRAGGGGGGGKGRVVAPDGGNASSGAETASAVSGSSAKGVSESLVEISISIRDTTRGILEELRSGISVKGAAAQGLA